MGIQLILVDDQDNELGYSTYDKCHKGYGQHHRAFVTLVIDSDNKVLLQRRKHKLFDGYWDFTAVSHPFFVNNKEDSLQEASNRALKKEMGIPEVSVENLGGFNYFSKDGRNCENEYCYVLVGNYDRDFKTNSNDVYEAKKVDFDEFIVDIDKNPKKYTPWAAEAVKILKAKKQNLFRANPPGIYTGDEENFEARKREPRYLDRGNLFKKEIAGFLEKYEPYSKAFYEKKIKDTAQYSPQVADLYKKLADFSEGGKRLRAFFVWLGYKAGGGGDLGDILPISLAFEMTQNFFLIHDDIMDNSDLRRGKPTIHKIYEKKHGPSISLRARRHYGESMAITLGDVAAIEAFKIIGDADFTDAQKAICLEEFSKVLLETGYGQALDLVYSYEKAGISQIYKIADLKAARYSICGPLLIGASLVGAKDVQKKAIVNFGLNAGLAFQLQDDYLGLFGDEETIGKSILSDMREGKNTLLIYKARKMSSVSDKAAIESIWGKDDASLNDLKSMRKVVEKSGALAWCREETQKLVKIAKGEIKKITTDVNLQLVFGQIAEYVASREN